MNDNTENKNLFLAEKDFENKILKLEKEMKKAAENLDFETAIRLRNEISLLRNKKMEL